MGKHKHLLVIFFCLFAALPLVAQESSEKQEDEVCISKQEMRLLNLINNLRINNNKPAIPLSASLTKVAKTHTMDLEVNHPDTSICNYHSWSDKGDWSSCCYNQYVVSTECIRNKPAELTDYKFPGYELITWDSRAANADSVFRFWNSYVESRNMFINAGVWERYNWNAIGLSISNHYVSIWFGYKPDKKEEPGLCSGEQITHTDSIISGQAEITGDKPYLAESEQYHIIYGSFSSEDEAEKAKKQLKDEFLDVGIIKGDVNYRISLDRFPSLQAARKAKDAYPTVYQDSWILKY